MVLNETPAAWQCSRICVICGPEAEGIGDQDHANTVLLR